MENVRFQVWNKVRKEMMEDCDVYIASDGSVLAGDLNYDGEAGMIVDVTDNVDIMLSTGLKDKNGTEIYEGYIVEIQDHPLQIKGGIGIEINGYYPVTYSRENMAFYIGDWKTRDVIDCVEVVGNIYENADLLKNK